MFVLEMKTLASVVWTFFYLILSPGVRMRRGTRGQQEGSLCPQFLALCSCEHCECGGGGGGGVGGGCLRVRQRHVFVVTVTQICSSTLTLLTLTGNYFLELSPSTELDHIPKY